MEDSLREYLKMSKHYITNSKKEKDADSFRIEMYKHTISEKSFEILEECKSFVHEAQDKIERLYNESDELKTSIREAKDELISSAVEEEGFEDDMNMNRQKAVFGYSLEKLVERDGTDIPRLVQHLVTYIKSHALDRIGIFRVAGNSAAVAAYKEDIDNGVDVNFLTQNDGHIASTLLKTFLRLLPESLTTFAYVDLWLNVLRKEGETDLESQADNVAFLIDRLPDEHMHLLDYLIQFCKCVSDNSEVNMMTCKNIASLIAPNIIYRKEVDADTALDDTAHANEVVEFMITYYDYIFQEITYDIKGEDITYEEKRETTPLFNLGIGDVKTGIILGIPGVVSVATHAQADNEGRAKKPHGDIEKKKRRKERRNKYEKERVTSMTPDRVDIRDKKDKKLHLSDTASKRKSTSFEPTTHEKTLTLVDPSELINNSPNLSALIDDSGSARGLLRRSSVSSQRSKIEIDKRETYTEESSTRKKKKKTKKSKTLSNDVPELDETPISPEEVPQDVKNSDVEDITIVIEPNVEEEAETIIETVNETINETVNEVDSKKIEDRKSDAFPFKRRIETRLEPTSKIKLINADDINEGVEKIFGNSALSMGYIILGYSDSSSLTLQYTGNEGIDDMVMHLFEDQVQYCLLRLPIHDTNTNTKSIRDVFIEWNGPSISNVEKGLKKSHVGDVKNMLHPYHIGLLALSKSSFNLSTVLEKSNPQNNSHVID